MCVHQTFAVRVYGPVGAIVMPVLVACSTMGALNGALLGSTRKYFAAARDGLFPRILATLHVKYNTPWISIMATTTISVAFIVLGDPVDLIEYLGFLDVAFYAVSCLCVLYLRFKYPTLNRPFKVPIGMAIVTTVILFGACVLALYEKPYRNGMGILFLISGLPAYYIGVVWKKPTRYNKVIDSCYQVIQKSLLVVTEDHNSKEL